MHTTINEPSDGGFYFCACCGTPYDVRYAVLSHEDDYVFLECPECGCVTKLENVTSGGDEDVWSFED